MLLTFYIAALVAVITTVLAITRTNAIHALLYLIVSLLSVAVVFFTMGAPFVAALEVIVYAGAIMVLFVFVVMMLNVGGEMEENASKWISPKVWGGPALLSMVLLIEMLYMIFEGESIHVEQVMTTPKEIGIILYTKYMLAVEIAAVMLMAGIVGAYHVARTQMKSKHRFLKDK